MRRELSAQLERVLGLGLPVTHVDTHQYTHLWPAVGQVVVDLAQAAGVPAVRLTTSHARSLVGLGVRALAGPLRARVQTAGLTGTADYAVLDEAGSMDVAAFGSALRAAARGGAPTLEINCHPGTAGEPDLERFAWDYHWGAEAAMLVDSGTASSVAASGYRLGGFSTLTGP